MACPFPEAEHCSACHLTPRASGQCTDTAAWLAKSIAEEERLARRCIYEERQEQLKDSA